MKKIVLILAAVVLVTSACKTVYTIQTPTPVEEEVKLEPYCQRSFDRCIAELKKIEGFKSNPYWDVNGYTIGYGHQLLKGETFTNLTEKEAEALLIQDFKQRVDYIHTKYGFTGNQLLAAARFMFNLGVTNVNRLFSKPNVANRWLLYCHYKHKGVYIKSKHLLACRKQELAMWLS